MVDSLVISYFSLVDSYLHGMQEKCPGPHQSFYQPREVIDWVHITLWILQRASSAKPYRSATLYIIVLDAPWSGTVCCPTSSIDVHRWGYFLSIGSIPVVMTGEMLKDHPMWYSNIVIKRVRGIYYMVHGAFCSNREEKWNTFSLWSFLHRDKRSTELYCKVTLINV